MPPPTRRAHVARSMVRGLHRGRTAGPRLALDPDGVAPAPTSPSCWATPTPLAMALGRARPGRRAGRRPVRVRGELAVLVAAPGRAGVGGGAARARRWPISPIRPEWPLPRSRASSGRSEAATRGQVAVVTGASAGLGAQLCRDLARAGAVVVGLARNEERLAALAHELRRDSPRLAHPRLRRRRHRRVCAAALDTGGRPSIGPVDLLVNNAAHDPGVRLADITEEDFRRTFDVNFFAPVAATLAVMPAMIERGQRHHVNVSSDGGRLPSPGPGAYPSSKAALSAFTESISFRLAPKGVRVHVVYPAFMPTELGLGALGRGLRKPPRLTTRSVESVSRRILARCRRPLARDQRLGPHRRRHRVPLLMPRTYHRLRRPW